MIREVIGNSPMPTSNDAGTIDCIAKSEKAQIQEEIDREAEQKRIWDEFAAEWFEFGEEFLIF